MAADLASMLQSAPLSPTDDKLLVHPVRTNKAGGMATRTSIKDQSVPPTGQHQCDCIDELYRNSPMELPSPPASPWATQPETPYDIEAFTRFSGVKPERSDPPLYSDGPGLSAQETLFPHADRRTMLSRKAGTNLEDFSAKGESGPEPRKHSSVSNRHTTGPLFLSSLLRSYNSNPGLYLRRVRDEALHVRSGKRHRPRWAEEHLSPNFIHTASFPKRDGPHVKSTRPSSSTLLPGARGSNFSNHVVPVRQQRILHTRAPSVKRPEDVHYQLLNDFSPSLSTLPNNPKALKTEWSSHNPLDLSKDPDRHLLHESELVLASTLRLSCATYLCSKRRIFQRVQEAYAVGKEFRKTDAQQACRIDVNKSSKLWIAFERVGWFKPSYFR